MKTLHILVGLQGSGKSTWSKKQLEQHNSVIWLESDLFRKEIFGSLNEQSPKDHAKVFEKMNKNLVKAMNEGTEIIIYDAMNLSRKRRSGLYSLAKSKGYNVEIDLFLRSFEYLVDIQKEREKEKRVSEHVIKIGYKNFNPPRIGYDCDEYVVQAIAELQDILKEIDMHRYKKHESPHHQETINQHIISTLLNTALMYNEHIYRDELCLISLYHDTGKSFCLTNEKPTRRDKLWFYRYNDNKFYSFNNHQNVSSMYALSLLHNENDVITENNIVIEGIYQHMKAHQGFDDKYIKKYKLTDEEINLFNTFAEIDGMSKKPDEYALNKMKEIREKE